MKIPAVVQTVPVIYRDGKCYGGMIISVGERQIRIVAEGDKDLIEQVYYDAANPPPKEHDPPTKEALADGCKRLVMAAANGNRVAIERVTLIIIEARSGDPEAISLYRQIRLVMQDKKILRALLSP